MLSFDSIVQVRVNSAVLPSLGNSFSTGLILCPGESPSGSGDVPRLFARLEDMISAGFVESDPAYLAAAAYFAADPGPDRVYVAFYAQGASPADALRQILNSETHDFYGVFCCETTPARLAALAADFSTFASRQMLFLASTAPVTEGIAAGGLFHETYEKGFSRVLVVQGADIYAGAAVMGLAMGLSRLYGLDAFALCYRPVGGMEPLALSESDVAAIKALNGNVYVRRGNNLSLFENGSTASGARFDEVLTLDRIAADLQSAALSLLTSGQGKLPQTDETSAVFINRFSSVLAGYTASGALATGKWRGNPVGALQPGDIIEGGYRLWADSYDLQSDADRAAHKAMPIHVALCLSGSVETLLIDVDVSL